MAPSLVDPSSDPTGQRVSLRETYKQAARSILKALETQSKPAYTHIELAAEFRVSVRPFDPESARFTDSEACLFQPLTVNELQEYKIDKKGLTEDEKRYLYRFADTFDDFPEDYPVPERCRMYDNASDISSYLEVFEARSVKKNGKYGASLEDLSYWDNIKAEDSFSDTGHGMLLGIADGHSKPQRLPSWRACSICQWLDEDLKATRPHIKLVTQTGAIAKEDELLHGELGPIANAILCRLEQPEFNNTSLFPVLVISLFAPRHGRLLQAKFDNSSTINVRCSPIYNFVTSDEEKLKLFVRYNNCTPRDGVEFEPVLFDKYYPLPPVQRQAVLPDRTRNCITVAPS